VLVIIPGSGYAADPDRPKQEGERVAKHYCEMGINVFCLRYRVSPDYQILCYPVIGFDRENYYIHQGSPTNLLGDKYEEYNEKRRYQPELIQLPDFR